RRAELGVAAPDLRDPVPPLDELVVDLGLLRRDPLQVAEGLGHQPGVEHAAVVGQVAGGVGAGRLQLLAGLAEPLPLARRATAAPARDGALKDNPTIGAASIVGASRPAASGVAKAPLDSGAAGPSSRVSSARSRSATSRPEPGRASGALAISSRISALSSSG